MKEVVDYVVSPEEIMELKLGEMFYIAKSPVQRREKIIIIPDESHLTGAQRYKKTSAVAPEETWEEGATPEVSESDGEENNEEKATPSTDEDYFTPQFEIKPSKTDFMKRNRTPVRESPVVQTPVTRPTAPARKPLPSMTPPANRAKLPSRPQRNNPPIENADKSQNPKLPIKNTTPARRPLPPAPKKPVPNTPRKSATPPARQGKTGDDWFS